MKIRKTRQDRRETYRYEAYLENDNGEYTKECIELKPGTDGVTEAWIKTLHSLDDHEVYLNCKNGHPPLTEAEKAAKRKWEQEHEGETYGAGWNLSLDYMVNKSSKRRYGRAWKRIRDKYVSMHPFCEVCYENGILVETEEVHHKKPLSEGGTHDRDNLIALCKSCHSRIHAERGDRFNTNREYTY